MRKCIGRTTTGQFTGITEIKKLADKLTREYFTACVNYDMSDLMTILITQANHQRTMLMLEETTSILDRVKRVILDNMDENTYQVFDTDNIVGDPTVTLFNEEGVTVKVCRGAGYFDVVGLSDEDFTELEKFVKEKREKMVLDREEN